MVYSSVLSYCSMHVGGKAFLHRLSSSGYNYSGTSLTAFSCVTKEKLATMNFAFVAPSRPCSLRRADTNTQ